MRQFSQSEATPPSAPVRPADQSSQADGYLLHPALQSVLANLDTQLEAELERYQKAVIQAGKGPGHRSTDHKLGLMALLTGSGRSPVASESPVPSAPITHRQAEPQPATAVPLEQVSPAGLLEYREPIPAITPNQSLPELKVSGLLSNSALVVTPSGNHPTELETNTSSATLSPSTSPELDGYLESSEELLRSLRQEETAIDSEQQFMKSLLTPLGMGSMALLLLSSAVFGYVLMNPSTLSQLLATRPTAPQAPATNQASPSGSAPVPNLAAQEFKDLNLQSLGSLSGGTSGGSATLRTPTSQIAGTQPVKTAVTPLQKPMVASGVVGAVGTGTIAPASRATAAISPPFQPSSSATNTTVPDRAPAPARVESAPVRRSTATAPSQPSSHYSYNQPRRPAPAPARPQPVTPAPRAAVRTPVPPAPTVAAPSVPTPATSNSVTAKSSPTPESLRYKVVTPFESDRALEAARQVVPDAYVRNTEAGAKVQLGAYPDAKAAEAKVEELRQQGISAEVYNP